jgi:hypothetical protein
VALAGKSLHIFSIRWYGLSKKKVAREAGAYTLPAAGRVPNNLSEESLVVCFAFRYSA